MFATLQCSKPAPTRVPPPGYPKPYRIGKNWYQPLPNAKGFSEDGIASWYGGKFHGKRTASGEHYNMYALTAAHKTLPLGTYVRVINLENQRKIDVRINDRGPFVRKRVIDLSYTAAKKLGIIGPGTAKVRVVALGIADSEGSKYQRKYIPVDYYNGNFTIQVGAFSDKQNAVMLRKRLEKRFNHVYVSTFFDGRKTYHRVRVGRCGNLTDTERLESLLRESGFRDAFAVAE